MQIQDRLPVRPASRAVTMYRAGATVDCGLEGRCGTSTDSGTRLANAGANNTVHEPWAGGADLLCFPQGGPTSGPLGRPNWGCSHHRAAGIGLDAASAWRTGHAGPAR